MSEQQQKAVSGYLADHPETLEAAVLNNSYRAIQPNAQATGLRTAQSRFDTLGTTRDERAAELFLLESRFRRDDVQMALSTQPYYQDAGLLTVSLIGREDPVINEGLALPPSREVSSSLRNVVEQRRSVREFTGETISSADLATLLRYGNGVTTRAGYQVEGGELPTTFRAAPSGGGLYPIEMYVAAAGVAGLDRGVYRYDAPRDVLVPEGGQEELAGLIGACVSPADQRVLSGASCVLFFVGHPWRTMRKYGSRGVRFLLLEAGGIAQNIHLAAEGLGLATVACGSFCDDEIHEWLDVDGLYRTFVHALIVGQPG